MDNVGINAILHVYLNTWFKCFWILTSSNDLKVKLPILSQIMLKWTIINKQRCQYDVFLTRYRNQQKTQDVMQSNGLKISRIKTKEWLNALTEKRAKSSPPNGSDRTKSTLEKTLFSFFFFRKAEAKSSGQKVDNEWTFCKYYYFFLYAARACVSVRTKFLLEDFFHKLCSFVLRYARSVLVIRLWWRGASVVRMYLTLPVFRFF